MYHLQKLLDPMEHSQVCVNCVWGYMYVCCVRQCVCSEGVSFLPRLHWIWIPSGQHSPPLPPAKLSKALRTSLLMKRPNFWMQMGKYDEEGGWGRLCAENKHFPLKGFCRHTFLGRFPIRGLLTSPHKGHPNSLLLAFPFLIQLSLHP